MTRVSSRVADNLEVNEEIGVGRHQPVLFVVLRPPASHIQSQQLERNKARIFYRVLLIAKVRIDQAIALGVAFRPLEVVEKAPDMKSANPNSTVIARANSASTVWYHWMRWPSDVQPLSPSSVPRRYSRPLSVISMIGCLYSLENLSD